MELVHRLLVEGPRRAYCDVEAEKANQLANSPNYSAHCKLVEGGLLTEYFIQSNGVELLPNSEGARGDS